MSVSTPIADARQSGRLHAVALIVAILVAVGVGAWAVTTNVGGSGTRPERSSQPTQASVLRSLTPQARGYVLGIMSLSPQQVQAAYGTGR
jgi:hypothetical protein